MAHVGEALRSIKTFDDLIRYLEDELDWPLREYEFEELTFEYLPEELGLREEEAAKVRRIHQLRPLQDGQPWGVFFVEFEKKKLPVVVLRRILSHLVVKKRASANRPSEASWHAADLLFVTAFGEEASEQREIAFAHFHQPRGDMPTVQVLGWDGADTVLHVADVAANLRAHLRWPDDPANGKAWREQWAKPFRHGVGHVIRTADALAEVLAALARGIRDRAKRMLVAESEKGPLRQLHKAFQTALIHDLTEEDFADTYAQTITYGLLTAAISRTEMSEGRRGTALIASNLTDMVPITNPFLREMLQTFLKVGGRKGAIDFDELGIQDVVELLRGDETDLPAVLRDFGNRTRGEDPVIHFYEHFLSAYNKQLKVRRGVFYTPRPVVSYIVRSVHELLQTEFGLEDGLASTVTWDEMARRNPELKIPAGVSPDSPFVLVLDPATGTATFLVEVIDVVHKTLTEKWKREGRAEPEIEHRWNEYVLRHLLPRLYGYELMMAAYAIAHMRLPLKLKETGFTGWDKLRDEDRVRIYLTNALEPARDVQQVLLGILPALAYEAAAVNEVKRTKRFTVVVGNPPYSGISSNMTEHAQQLVDAYKVVDGKALNERKLWLQDDYVKFIRAGQTVLEQTRTGVLGYITNHGYLDNPTFRGMRQSLVGSFQRLRLLDLHGNANKKEQSPDGSADENVFDIRQGVAICLATRANVTPRVQHGELWAAREAKYGWLALHSVVNTTLETLSPDSPYYFFEPQKTDCRVEYDKGWKINEAMPVHSAGFITARDHFVVDFERRSLLARVAEFANAEISDDDIRTRYFAGCGSDKYIDGDTRGWKVPDARKRVQSDKSWHERVRTCLYRPFDERQVYWTSWMVDWPRPELTRHLDIEGNKALITTRMTKDQFSAFVSVNPPGHKSVGAYDVNYVFPVLTASSRGGQPLLAEGDWPRPNFSLGFLRSLGTALGFAELGQSGMPDGLTSEDIFHYVYAVFHSPTYRTRYAEFLKIDFPRLPLTSSLDLFRALAKLGGELVALHLVEFALEGGENDEPADWPRYPRLTRFVGGDRKPGKRIGGKGKTLEAVADGVGRVYVNETSYFGTVPEAAWNFHIGGYQVCHKWLDDRRKAGRSLSDDDLLHYAKIVTALSETIRLMTEIDAVIDQHGGWPGAFATRN